MASHTHDVLRRAIWASLTGGYCYDPSLDLFCNTFHLYLWLFLLIMPLFFFVVSTWAAWIGYTCLIVSVFVALKVTNYRLHATFDHKTIQHVAAHGDNEHASTAAIAGDEKTTKVEATSDIEMQILTPVEFSPQNVAGKLRDNNSSPAAVSESQRDNILRTAACTSFLAMEDETMIAGSENTAQFESLSLNPGAILRSGTTTGDRNASTIELRALSVGSGSKIHNRRKHFRGGRGEITNLKVDVHQERGSSCDKLLPAGSNHRGSASPDATLSFDVMRQKLYAVGSMEQLPDDNVATNNNFLTASSNKEPHQTCSSTSVSYSAIVQAEALKSVSGGDLVYASTPAAAAEGNAIRTMRHASSSCVGRSVTQRAELSEGRSAASVTNQPSASMETILCTFIRPANNLEEQIEALLRSPVADELDVRSFAAKPAESRPNNIAGKLQKITTRTSSLSLRVGAELSHQTFGQRRAKSDAALASGFQNLIPVSSATEAPENADIAEITIGALVETDEPKLADTTEGSNPPIGAASEAALDRFLPLFNTAMQPATASDARAIENSASVSRNLPLSGIISSMHDSHIMRRMLNSHCAYISGKNDILGSSTCTRLSVHHAASTATNIPLLRTEELVLTDDVSTRNEPPRLAAHESDKRQCQPSCSKWPYDRLAADDLKFLLETREENVRRPQHRVELSAPPLVNQVKSLTVIHVDDDNALRVTNADVDLEKRITYSPRTDSSSEDDVYVNIVPQSLLAVTSSSSAGNINGNNASKPKLHFFATSSPEQTSQNLHDLAAAAAEKAPAVDAVQRNMPETPILIAAIGNSEPVLSRGQQWSFRSHTSGTRHTDVDYQSSDSSLSPGSASHVDNKMSAFSNYKGDGSAQRIGKRNSASRQTKIREDSPCMWAAPMARDADKVLADAAAVQLGRRRSSADAAFDSACVTSHPLLLQHKALPLSPSQASSQLAKAAPFNPQYARINRGAGVHAMTREDNRLTGASTSAGVDSRRQNDSTFIFPGGQPVAQEIATSTFYSNHSRNDGTSTHRDAPHSSDGPAARRHAARLAAQASRRRTSSTSGAVASSVAAALVRYPFAQRLRGAERQRQRQHILPAAQQLHPSALRNTTSSAITRVSAATSRSGTNNNERMPHNVQRHQQPPLRISRYRHRSRSGRYAVNNGEPLSSGVDEGLFQAAAQNDVLRRVSMQRRLLNRNNSSGVGNFGTGNIPFLTGNRRSLSPSTYRATCSAPAAATAAGRNVDAAVVAASGGRQRRRRPPMEVLNSIRNVDGTIDADILRVFTRTYAPPEFRGNLADEEAAADRKYDYLFYENDNVGEVAAGLNSNNGAVESHALLRRTARRYGFELVEDEERLATSEYGLPPPTALYDAVRPLSHSTGIDVAETDPIYENLQQGRYRHNLRDHGTSFGGGDVSNFDSSSHQHLFTTVAPASWRHLWYQARFAREPDRSLSKTAKFSETVEYEKLALRSFYTFNWLPLPFKHMFAGEERGNEPNKIFNFMKGLRKLTSSRIRFDRIALFSLMDRDKSICMMLGALSATLSTCLFAWLMLGYFEFYHDLEVVIFCLVVASCQYSLIKSVQPDAVSPTHGFNHYTAFSRAIYFCLLCSLLLGFHWLSGDDGKVVNDDPILPLDADYHSSMEYYSNYADPVTDDTVFSTRAPRGVADFPSVLSCSDDANKMNAVLHTLAPELDKTRLFGLDFERMHVYSRWICSFLRVILLLFPLIFTYGLLPQVPTFIMTVCQEVDVHVFGGDSPTSTVTSVVNVVLSMFAAGCVFVAGYLAVLAMPAAAELSKWFVTQPSQISLNNYNVFVTSNDLAARNLAVSAWVAMIVVVAFLLSRSTIKLGDLWRGIVRLLLASDNNASDTANNSGSDPAGIPPAALEVDATINSPENADIDIDNDEEAVVQQKLLLTTSQSAPEIGASSSSQTEGNFSPANASRFSDAPQPSSSARKGVKLAAQNKAKPKRRNLKPAVQIDHEEFERQKQLQRDRFQSDMICSAAMFAVVFGLHASGLFSQPRDLARITLANAVDENGQDCSSRADLKTRLILLSSGNIFDTLRAVLTLSTCIVGVLLHYFLVEMRMENPWLSFTRPFLRSHEYNEFEPRLLAHLMKFERVFALLTFFERYGLYTLCTMAYVWNDAWILAYKFDSVVISALLVTLAAGKFLRQAYSATHRQFIVLGMTLLFFHFDARHLSSGAFLLDAFVMAFVVDKLEEIYLKLTFVFAYIAPWQITWGSAFHAFAQPFSLPHTMMLVTMAVISTALNAPLTPFLGSAIFITSYSRPQKFWEKNYQTTRWDASNSRMAQQVGAESVGDGSPHVAAASASGAGGLQDDSNLNSIFYENLCNALRERVAGEIALGRWGRVSRGDFFILASENLNCMVHIIGMANGAVTFQLRGLEFRGTVRNLSKKFLREKFLHDEKLMRSEIHINAQYCQQREVEAISEGIDSKSQCCLGIGACRVLCCCFCKSSSSCCSNNPFRNLPRFLTLGAGFSLRCLAWRVAAVKLIVPGYSVSENSATAMLQMHDLRRNMLTLLTKSIIYYLTRHKSLNEWISTMFDESGGGSLMNAQHDPEHVDLDPLFTAHFDEDYDDMVGGVSRVRFVQVYEQWLTFCCEKASTAGPNFVEFDAKASSKLTTLCYAASILVRRALAVAASRSATHNIDMFLYGLYTLFKGDFRIQAVQDEWIFGAFDIMTDVLQPALRMSIKLHQDHFSYGEEWLTHCDPLYEAIEANESSCVICHEADPAWRRNIAANFPTLVSLRHHITDDTNHEYKFIMLNHKPLTFRLIAINRECVRGFWAGQLQELIYLRNRNPERGSIQNAKQVLRNIINSSCDQPIGYPIYVSPLITSYVETHADIRRILGGPVTVKSVRECLRSIWNGVYNYFAAGCLSGGVLSGLANSANNSRTQQRRASRGAVYAAGRTTMPQSSNQQQRIRLLTPNSSSAVGERDAAGVIPTDASAFRASEYIPLKTLASSSSRSFSNSMPPSTTNAAGEMLPNASVNMALNAKSESFAHGGGKSSNASMPQQKLTAAVAAPMTRRSFFERATAATAVQPVVSATSAASFASSSAKGSAGSRGKKSGGRTAYDSASLDINKQSRNTNEKLIEMMPMGSSRTVENQLQPSSLNSTHNLPTVDEGSNAVSIDDTLRERRRNSESNFKPELD